MIIDYGVYLRLDRVPNTVKSILSIAQLVPEAIVVALYAKLVPRRRIAEMKAGGNGEVCFEEKGKGGNDAFAAGASVSDEEASFCRVKNPLGGINQLADLENCCPDGTITAGDCCSPFPIVEHLVKNEGAAEAKES